MPNQQLIDYIKQATEQGQSREQIKTTLLGSGWQEGDIEMAFSPVDEIAVPQSVSSSIPLPHKILSNGGQAGTTQAKIKRSYNPFKMRGSWIGLGISLVMFVSFFASHFLPLRIFSVFLGAPFLPLFEVLTFGKQCSEMGCLFVDMLVLIISPIYGFLIGWGVHSLFREMEWKIAHKKMWSLIVAISIILFMLFYPAERMQCNYSDKTPPRNIIQEVFFHKCGKLDFGESCRNNSECLSNDCANFDPVSYGRCSRPNSIQRLLD